MSHEDDWKIFSDLTDKSMKLVSYPEKEAAKIIAVQPETMRRWRGDGLKFPDIPRWFRVGGSKKGSVRYRHADLLEWMVLRIQAESGDK